MSPNDLAVLLDNLAPDLELLGERWTIVGSAALMLLGLELEIANDLDIVTSVVGAGGLRTRWAAWRVETEAKDPDGPFRSEDFARYETPWGPVEIMGGLKVLQGGKMRPLLIGESATGRRYLSAQDQLRILRLFGRPKDLAKAAQLEAWLAPG